MDVIPIRVDCPMRSASALIGTTERSVSYLSQKQEENSSSVTRLDGSRGMRGLQPIFKPGRSDGGVIAGREGVVIDWGAGRQVVGSVSGRWN
ncbi:hypothetical protein PFAS1_00515 [Pseudomonas frederiksbergensis]|nr:hypothetical protein PFAS1_00515 [Pseudomonas frederiksbergensis]